MNLEKTIRNEFNQMLTSAVIVFHTLCRWLLNKNERNSNQLSN